MTRHFLAGVALGAVLTALLLVTGPLAQQEALVDVLDKLRFCRLELGRGISVTPSGSCMSGGTVWPQRSDGMCYLADAAKLELK